MGEHTIREVLKRRSTETQRELQKRRDQVLRGNRSKTPLLILAVVVLLILGAVAYTLMQAKQVSDRLTTDMQQHDAHPLDNISLQSITAFLPNTVLAVRDPAFYDAGATTVSPVTRALVRHYFPHASALAVRIMATTAQIRFSRTNILETYINDTPMGHDSGKPVTGFVGASQAYFHKPLAQLQPQEIALLVAMMSNPEQLDPRRFPNKALAARNQVLLADAQQTVLSQDQANALTKLPLGVVP